MKRSGLAGSAPLAYTLLYLLAALSITSFHLQIQQKKSLPFPGKEAPELRLVHMPGSQVSIQEENHQPYLGNRCVESCPKGK